MHNNADISEFLDCYGGGWLRDHAIINPLTHTVRIQGNFKKIDVQSFMYVLKNVFL